MIKKYKYLYFIISLLFSYINAQEKYSDIEYDVTKPVPSISSFSTFTNTPISYATGAPDISIDLFNLPTYNKNTNIHLYLLYNSMNVSRYEKASDVGMGWTLFGGGYISRSIIGEVDEIKYEYSQDPEFKFDDIYYYNIPGSFGSFKFVRNKQDGTFKIIHIGSNNIKIDYKRNSNKNTLIIDSFYITDGKGIRYIYDIYSRKKTEEYLNRYRSAFLLTRIEDQNGVVLANFEYYKNTKYVDKNITKGIDYEIYKLKSITSGFGKIEIEYNVDPEKYEDENDIYYVQSIKNKNYKGKTIYEYNFKYDYHYKRILRKIIKKTERTIEEITLDYKNITFDNIFYKFSEVPTLLNDLFDYDMYLNRGVLSKITTSTGKIVKYDFEPNDYYEDMNDEYNYSKIINGTRLVDPEAQYIKKIQEIDYNTNLSDRHTVIIPKNESNEARKIFIKMVVDELFPSLIWDERKLNINYYILDKNEKKFYRRDYYSGEHALPPGEYTLNITGSGGRGKIIVYGLDYNLPIKNRKYEEGVRIAKIRYYNDSDKEKPVSIKEFKYSKFGDDNSSSGVRYRSDLEVDGNISVIYKNVEVTEKSFDGKIKGIKKYYYKSGDEFPKNEFGIGGRKGYWSYSNYTKGGMLDKVEEFNALAKIVSSTDTNYTFYDSPNKRDSLALNLEENIVIPSRIKKIEEVRREYFNSGVITKIKERYFNENNPNIKYVKDTEGDDIKEIRYFYPDQNTPSLTKKNMIDNPIRSEYSMNGVLLSTIEINYNNLDLPSEIVEKGYTNDIIKKIKISKYDDKGNVLEYRINNLPTTVVWGYNKTLPIAKVEGASYEKIKNYVSKIIEKSEKDIDISSENIFKQELNHFRNISNLNEYLITTYTYDPVIGLKSIIYPTGIEESYTYDVANRVNRIIDKDKNIIKEYTYNDKEIGSYPIYTNSFHSKRISNNMCPLNTFPGEYVYIVPQGIYQSTISQKDADQKALDDIQHNGQDEANKNTICHKIYYSEYVRHIFTNNECRPTDTGGKYIYTIPPGVYTSIISQEDADYKAIQDVNTKGMEQAKPFLRCTSSYDNVKSDPSFDIF